MEGGSRDVPLTPETQHDVPVSRAAQARILLVEDNPADCRLIEEALKTNGRPYHLSVCNDGVQALRMLLHAEPYANAPRPDIILLDLNLPGLSGWEVLRAIKQNTELMEIPVLILTSSRAREEILRAYRNYANSYFCKPTRISDAFNLIEEIYRYWFRTSVLPSRTDIT
jgi:chemotaxis family two-component system response regulator Rcp1